MIPKNKYRNAAVLLCVLAIISFFTLTVSATGETVSVTGVSGVTVGVNSSGTATESNGTVTVTATGSLTSTKTATITITNTSGSTATISFDYTLTKCNSTTLASNTGGTYSETFTSGESKTFTITSNKGLSANRTVTLTMSNFKVEAAAASSNVTLTYGSLGSVTVDGTTAASESVHEVSSATGASFVAVSGSGNTFLAWIDPATNAVLSTDATYQVIPTADMAIKAVFTNASSDACFWAGNKGYLFESLSAATNYATSTSNKVIVLAADGTLPALKDADGNDIEVDYTIPSGVTLLIPNDAANTLYTTTPGKSNSAASAYRTLTMENGASITVNGAISVAGMQNGNHNDYADGAASGSLGYINMQSGSTITINQNANLYCWGYIIGDGAVNVYGTVYEDLQIADWRGGDALSQIYDNDLGIMPLTMFYVQNVQVPMTLHHGAVEIVVTRATASLFDKQMDCVFLGTGGVIGLLDSNATLIKDYDDVNDRIVFILNGNCTIGGITINVPTGTLGFEVEIDSTKFYMPVNTTWDFIVKEGSNVTVSQDVALTPGSRFIIEKKATVSLAENARICVYDADNWGAYAFTGVPDCDNIHVPANLRDLISTHDHSDEYTRDAMIQVDGILDTSKGNFYTTTGGANICSTSTGQIIVGTNANTSVYQYEQINDTQDSGSDDYKKLGTVEIAVTPAQLKNADGNYVATATGGAGTYNYLNGFWHKGTCADYAGDPTYEKPNPATHEYEVATYCTVCNQELSRAKSNMICLDAINASADAEIILMLYFTDPCGLLDGATATVTMTTNGETVACEDAKFEYVNGRFLVSQPVASGEMTSPVTVTFTDAQGNIIPVYDYIEGTCSDSVTKTVTDYAERVLAIGADKQKNIIKALVTYGGYSQINFGTNVDDLAYGILGTSAPELGEVTIKQEVTPSGSVTGLTQDGQQAFLDSAIYLRVYFVLSDGSINDYTFKLTRPNGSTATLTAQYDSAKGKYFVDILNIPAAYMDDDYTITVTRGTETLTVNTSVFAYLAKVLAEGSGATEAQKNAAMAMYLYGAAATEFFGK